MASISSNRAVSNMEHQDKKKSKFKFPSLRKASKVNPKKKAVSVEADFKCAVSGEVEDKIRALKSVSVPQMPADVVESYWLEKPFAAAVITRESTGYMYHVITPSLTSEEYEVLNRVYHRLVDRLSLLEEDTNECFPKEASKIINAYIKVDKVQEAKIAYFLKRKSLGYDSIDPLYKDNYIEEITCNGPNLPVYVYHIEYGFIATSIIYGEANLDDFTQHLAELANRHICIGEPVAEAALKDGSRLTAFWRNEVSDRGSSFALRKIRSNPLSPLDLIKFKTYNSDIMALVWYLVEHRINMLIIGGTASGKTTTLNALSLFIPKNRRIISIEDTRELRLNHDNWVPLITRTEKKVEGVTGGIDEMFLLKRALRLRPEYLLVGEVRGEEARILFQAMNTGHTVFSTIHAGSVEEAFIRLFNPPISVPPAMIMPLDIVMVQSMVQTSNKEVRRCLSLAEIKAIDVQTRSANLVPLYTWDAQTDMLIKNRSPTRVIEKLKRVTGKDQETIIEEIRQRKLFLDQAIQDGVKGYLDFINLLDVYRQKTVDQTSLQTLKPCKENKKP